jgi:hypothetical protein
MIQEKGYLYFDVCEFQPINYQLSYDQVQRPERFLRFGRKDNGVVKKAKSLGTCV